MTIETLAVLLIIAVVAAILGRALAGYNLGGCLIAYVLACLGAVGGWIVQDRFFGPDNLLLLPLASDPARVSVIGASIGALALALIAGLLNRPPRQVRRTRYRR